MSSEWIHKQIHDFPGLVNYNKYLYLISSLSNLDVSVKIVWYHTGKKETNTFWYNDIRISE